MEKISRKVDKIEDGKIFTYSDFNLPNTKFEVLAKSLSRLKQKGVIERVSRGVYYKPKQTAFGRLKPSEDQLLELIKEKNDAYLTGNSAYNKLGLTTQISNEYVLACSKEKKSMRIGGVRVRFVRRDRVDKNKVKLLQVLDALKDIKSIPDANTNYALSVLIGKIKTLDFSERKDLAKLAMEYNPATRALTGAILEVIGSNDLTTKLKKSLNPLTKYKLEIKQEVLPSKSAWYII